MKPNQVFFLDRSEETRFWNYVNVLGLDECWEWLNGRDEEGYGLFYMRREKHRAHRVAWTVCFDLIEDGLNILHHCDNYACCNPGHLFKGTHDQNMKDMVSKDRSTFGIKSTSAKLDDSLVVRIRSEYIHGCRGFGAYSLGKKYGVSHTTIQAVLKRSTWKRVQ